MKNLMGGLYGVSEWVARFAVTNVLWLFFNFPIAILVMNMLVMDESSARMILIIPIAILAPFLFFPATAAMFATVRNWILKKEDQSIIIIYWKFYRENYKKSLLSGVLLTLMWIVWGIDFAYISSKNVLVMFSFLGLGLLLFVYTINFFSLLAHYEMAVIKLLKNSMIVTIGSPVLSLAVLLTSFIILYVSINGALFLLPFFVGSLISFVSFSAFYRYYLKTLEEV
ncbi:YesL family protein [Aquibacillus kalidii]|uniref:YesL family protein n=1 Tax=Aquibacillus kalidii TaxID=2762597 RepID=UPI001649607C|nr:DUF624 domain-containing protein [Aquibacillus kalidii]